MNKTDHRENFFKTADNLDLYEQSWRPSDPVAVVVIVHGYAEHSGRYQWVTSQFGQQGFAVYMFDLRGHGKSAGVRGFVRSFDDHLADLELFLKRVEQQEPDKPIFLLGHSMGGAIAALFTIRHQPRLQGLVLSSAVLGLSSRLSPRLVQITTQVTAVLSNWLPGLPTLLLDRRAICRDPMILTSYETDPLVYRQRMPMRTLVGILKTIAEIQARITEVEMPLLVLHGTADRLVTMEGSQKIYSSISGETIQLKLYEGFYHELLNEPGKEQVLADIIAWLRMHLPTG
ncbi:MAG: alpha/beta hydrolase [Elainella sp. C42_A2020_010]|nr:alpha/beta hydrolase [Elainella sp. C42_A2020_010]